MQAAYVIFSALILAALGYLLMRTVGGAYLRYRGTRVIICPETQQGASVQVDAGHAATAAYRDAPELRLIECSRWPERRNCGQECLKQIEASPDGCLMKNILTQWYEGRSCNVCARNLGHIDWLNHKPGLINLDGKSMLWDEIEPAKVFEVLASHKPVCWNCHVAETFRREHPDLVVDRPWHRQGPAGQA